jgi:hypothetical protein
MQQQQQQQQHCVSRQRPVLHQQLTLRLVLEQEGRSSDLDKPQFVVGVSS